MGWPLAPNNGSLNDIGIYDAEAAGVQVGVQADQAATINAWLATLPAGATAAFPPGVVWLASAMEILVEQLRILGSGMAVSAVTGTIFRCLPGFTDSQMLRNWTASDWQAGRTDAGCTVTNASSTVLDPSITAADAGKCVRGPAGGGGIPPGCVVHNPVAGVSFTLWNPYALVPAAVTASVAGGPISVSLTIGEPDHFFPPINDAHKITAPRTVECAFDLYGASNVTCIGRVHPEERAQIHRVSYNNTLNNNNSNPRLGTGNMGRFDSANGNLSGATLVSGVREDDLEIQYENGWKGEIWADGTCGYKLPVAKWQGEVNLFRTTSFAGPGIGVAYSDSPFKFVGLNQVVLDTLHTQAQPPDVGVELTFAGTVAGAVVTSTDGTQFDKNLMGAIVLDSAGNTAYVSAVGALPVNALTVTAISGVLTTPDTYKVIDNAWVRTKDCSVVQVRKPVYTPRTDTNVVGNTVSTTALTMTDGHTFDRKVIGCAVTDTTNPTNIPVSTTIVDVDATGTILTLSAAAGTQTGDTFVVHQASARPIGRNTVSGLTGAPNTGSPQPMQISGAGIGKASGWVNGSPFLEDYGGGGTVRLVYQSAGFAPVGIESYDGLNMRYDYGTGPTPAKSAPMANYSPTVFTATNAAWPIPQGATYLRITAVGGGGGGGGGGSAAAAQLNVGGGGGGAGGSVVVPVAVGTNTTLAITVGAGSPTNIAGGTAGGNAGSDGASGGDTTVIGNTSGISVTAKGGGPGKGGGASSTTVVNGGAFAGGTGTVANTASATVIAAGGSSSAPGGSPLAASPGGGGGGGAATATLGGGGGAAGIFTNKAAAGSSGASGTAAGVQGSDAAANSGGGGGGGGGGAAGTGAGGNGGKGGSGYVIVEVLL